MAAVPSADISSINVVMSRGVLLDTKFSLVNGDIAKQQLDVIVNTTNTTLDLMNAGEVSKAIGTAGGLALQQECKSKYPKGFKTGEVAVTGVHGLPALKAVYHVHLSGWDDSAKDKITEALKKALNAIMQKATDIGMESIGLPAIGSGLNKYPPEIVAEVILDQVTRFVDFHPETTIRKVVFVVHESNQDVIRAFMNKFCNYRWSDQQSLGPNNSADSGIQANTSQFVSNQGQATNALVVELTPGTTEYKTVNDSIPQDARDKIKIVRIQRVVNQALNARYLAYRSRIPAPKNERSLYYGTEAQNLRRITENGFESDREETRMFQEFGRGQCFVLEPSYPLDISISTPDTDGNRILMQCKVVTGTHTEGNGDTTAPPDGCHSTVNDSNNPNWFVVYDTDAAYPEFIITFR